MRDRIYALRIDEDRGAIAKDLCRTTIAGRHHHQTAGRSLNRRQTKRFIKRSQREDWSALGEKAVCSRQLSLRGNIKKIDFVFYGGGFDMRKYWAQYSLFHLRELTDFCERIIYSTHEQTQARTPLHYFGWTRVSLYHTRNIFFLVQAAGDDNIGRGVITTGAL